MPGASEQTSSGFTHFIAVGAVYIDTILNVPYFPSEDSKLRATSLVRRRGGNCANLLEVLQQLIYHRPRLTEHHDTPSSDRDSSENGPKSEDGHPRTRLHLLSVLPNRYSDAVKFTRSSFDSDPMIQDMISVENCFYRSDKNDAASSFIVSAASRGTRTSVNYNDLQDMRVDEFIEAADVILSRSKRYKIPGVPPRSWSGIDDRDACTSTPIGSRSASDKSWFHFEGRTPDVLASCMMYLSGLHGGMGSEGAGERKEKSQVVISVEVEKPGREGLLDLARLADVVFYSRAWALEEGYKDAVACLKTQARCLCYSSETVSKEGGLGDGGVFGLDEKHSNDHDLKGRWLFCTWGEAGSAGAFVRPKGSNRSDNVMERILVVERPAWSPSDPSHGKSAVMASREKLCVVDTVGAGDSWTAAMLYCLLHDDGAIDWTRASDDVATQELSSRLDFANEVAARKISRDGFTGLGSEMRDGLLTSRISSCDISR